MKKTILLLLIALSLNGYSQKIGLNIGDKAPEIAQNSPNGKEIKLSSLKGKMVLIDFWASWCGPCRHENPAVVHAYKTYKDANFKNGKGFTVFSVSFDRNLDSWKKAISADKLEWTNHVSDLQYWSNAAGKIYEIQSIPSNFLIDGDGIIIAKNLRGESLLQAIESVKKAN